MWPSMLSTECVTCRFTAMMSETAMRLLIIGPALRIELFRIADDAVDLGHPGKCGRLDLRRAAGDDDARGGPLAFDPADALARLPHRFRRHRAGVDYHRIVESAGGTADRFRLGDIEPAAEGDDVDGHEAPALLNSAGSNLPANSNSTGPVIST